jgi:hypothetical protein
MMTTLYGIYSVIGTWLVVGGVWGLRLVSGLLFLLALFIFFLIFDRPKDYDD